MTDAGPASLVGIYLPPEYRASPLLFGSLRRCWHVCPGANSLSRRTPLTQLAAALAEIKLRGPIERAEANSANKRIR